MLIATRPLASRACTPLGRWFGRNYPHHPVGLIGLGLFACSPAGTPTPSTPASVHEPAAAFVQTKGTRFEIDGAPHVVVGTNFWSAMNLGSAGPGGDRARLQRELDRLAALGINNVRVMASSEGPNGAPYRMAPALMNQPGQYDAQVFEGLDVVLAECATRQIRVVLVLNNFWEWSGGMAQYVAWAEGTAIPYPAENVWTDFTAYTARFYSCPQCQAWYREHIRAVVERTNSVNHRSYREDPTIFAWELANEPRLYPATWIDETADYIRSLGVRQMITTGSEGRIGGPFLETHDGSNIDYTTAHLWPQNWQWFDPNVPASLEPAIRQSLAYIKEHIDGSQQLGKPLVLEEYGLARDHGSGLDPYDPRTPVTQRDHFYAAVLHAVETSVHQQRALHGQAFWAWAGEGRAPNPWLGDPPHEKPGWYSVYDTDTSTLRLLQDHAARMSARAN